MIEMILYIIIFVSMLLPMMVENLMKGSPISCPVHDV